MPNWGKPSRVGVEGHHHPTSSGQLLAAEANGTHKLYQALKQDAWRSGRRRCRGGSGLSDGSVRAQNAAGDPGYETNVAPWVEPEPIVADAVRRAAGREANVERLNLKAAGVRFKENEGIAVNDYLRTSNRRVFAVGDVCLHGYKLTRGRRLAS